MYLMNLGNIDYIVITIIFAIIFVTAYLFRRKNDTATKFLFATDKAEMSQTNSWIIACGVVEFVLLGIMGALYGVSAFYYLLVAVVLAHVVLYYINNNIAPYSIYEYLQQKIGVAARVSYAILVIVLLLGICSVIVAISSKLYLSLLGWNFVNSTFAVMGLSIVYVLVGGYKGISYIRKLQLALVFLIFISVIIISICHFNGVGSFINNLNQLSTSQGKPTSFYTAIRYSILNIPLWVLFMLLTFIPLVTAVKVQANHSHWLLILAKVSLFILMLFSGVIAIGSDVAGNINSHNNKIVTYQAQLPDGQIGYVIKAIDAKATQLNPVPGIIPPVLDGKTGLMKPNSYDYKLATIVVFKHYLPKYLDGLIVLMILLAFMYSISQYLIAVAKIIAIDVYAPLNYLQSYGEEGKLWLVRMAVIVAAAISLFAGYYLVPYLELPLTRLVFIILITALSIFTVAVVLIKGKLSENTEKK